MPAAKKTAAARKAPEPKTLDELAELYRLRDRLWRELDEDVVGKQKLGIGAIAAQLTKTVERIVQLENTTNEEAPSLASQLDEARKRRADGNVRTSRRGTKSAR